MVFVCTLWLIQHDMLHTGHRTDDADRQTSPSGVHAVSHSRLFNLAADHQSITKLTIMSDCMGMRWVLGFSGCKDSQASVH